MGIGTRVHQISFSVGVVVGFQMGGHETRQYITAATKIGQTFARRTIGTDFYARPTMDMVTKSFSHRKFGAHRFAFQLFSSFDFRAAQFDPTRVRALGRTHPILYFHATEPHLGVRMTINTIVFTERRATRLGLHRFFFRNIRFDGNFIGNFFIIDFCDRFRRAEGVFRPLFRLIRNISGNFRKKALFARHLYTFKFIPSVQLFRLNICFFRALFLNIMIGSAPWRHQDIP